MRKYLNTSASTYENIINANFMYVDKTKELYKIINHDQGQYFLSRPRRFGKSMLLSTLRAVFEGKKELFKNQYIYNQEYDWKEYPIIHLKMNSITTDTIDNFKRRLMDELDDISKKFSITLNRKTPEDKFNELIKILSTDKKVVILIDEYDKPVLDNVLDQPKCKEILAILKSFYGNIKSQEEYIRFAFITGVSKFTKVSIFSDLNNLTDMTMDKRFASVCGFTQEECEHYFAEWIAENAEELDMTKYAYLAKLKDMYNGIRFSEKKVYVYNPVSFTKAMDNCDFKNYWFETGTPTFLNNLIKKDSKNSIENRELKALEDFEELKVTSEIFSKYEIDDLGVIPLAYQTGYLTIKDYDIEEDEYILSYPNKEVRVSFVRTLMQSYAKVAKGRVSMILNTLYDSLKENKIEEFIEALTVYYATVDYDLKTKEEKCYQLIFYLIFANLNFKVKTEVKTNKGRMDAVVLTKDYIYIFEFKLDKSADVAIEQIKEKEYYQKYLLDDRDLILVGVNFDSETGNIKDWKETTPKSV